MKSVFLLLLGIFALGATSLAQVSPEPATAPGSSQSSSPKTPDSAPANATAPAVNQLAAGTVISVELSKSLDAKKNKANDKIEAKTAMDLLAHGQIVVPRNTKIIGHVTEAKRRSKTSPDSMIGIIFDRMRLKDGREIPLQLAVQAIGRPLQFESLLMSNPPSAENPAGVPTTMPGQPSPIGSPSVTGIPYPPRSRSGSPPDPMATSGSTVSPLGPTSRGVIGMKGLSLESSGPASVVSSSTENVHLDSGTQLILRVQ